MNIRAKILGGASSSEKPILSAKKKPRGAKVDSLDGLIAREEARTNHSRFDDRHRLLDEVVKVTSGRKSREVSLINVSGGGAMIGGNISLALWDKVELHLGENGTVECVVRWVKDGRFGLEFAHETRIDCGVDKQAAILREVIRKSFPDLEFEADSSREEQREGPEGRGARRHPMVWSGLLHHDYESSPVRVRNISATGAMIECTDMLTIGSEPLLELGPELSVSAVVAWVLGDQAGLRFSKPFDLDELARSRPGVAGSRWTPPAYLETAEEDSSPWGEHWGRMSLGELRTQLEGFLKR
ncbi:MAG TPA: PilZ domain-containing protein [Sphingomicrobium sp.]|nr:PilZ domain-containing protein [Sphingomicrobium sp.]